MKKFKVSDKCDITILNNKEPIIKVVDISSKNVLIDNDCRQIKIELGLCFKVRDFVYKQLLEMPYIQDNFKLNVIRLNRWWYSVYFDKICKHKNEPIINRESCFCPDCGVKL